MKVIIYTDGAARGNPDGPGGYGAILQYTDPKGQLHEKEVSAGYQKTTNNRMELMAVIAGLSELNRPCEVTVYSDSKYVVPSALTIEGFTLKDASPNPLESLDAEYTNIDFIDPVLKGVTESAPIFL